MARNLDRHGIPRHRPPLDRATLERLYVDERLGVKAGAARLGRPGRPVGDGEPSSGVP